jgi:glycerol-3-phosphate acyltransferase PlsY
MLELAIKTLLAYGLGSLMGALIVGRLRGVDIRTLGSGNAGGTNALRTQGIWFALGVVIIDVSKGWFAAAMLPALALPGVNLDPALDREQLTYACAAAAALGHVYPVWWEFRGGKGAATLIGVLLGSTPVALVPVLSVWLVSVIVTGFVGLSTMLGVIALPVTLIWRGNPSLAALVFSLSMAAFVVYTHRGNIERMREGNEHRARRLWYRSYLKGSDV